MNILIDMSNLAIDSLQSAFAGMTEVGVIDEKNIRHIILKRISEIHKKLGRHNSVILCFDSKNYWRKDYFPYYKMNRKKTDSSFVWSDYYHHYAIMKEELPLYFPYKCIEVDRCEGDDVINVLSNELNGNVIIVSSDTDDLQILERYPHAKQYSLKHNKFIDCEMYNYTLREHIITGDDADCIPSIISDADTYVNPDKRCKPLTKKKKAQYNFIIPSEYDARFKENEKIIDMDKIPDNYRDAIIDEYNKEPPKKLGNALNYCIKYKLNNLLKFL